MNTCLLEHYVGQLEIVTLQTLCLCHLFYSLAENHELMNLKNLLINVNKKGLIHYYHTRNVDCLTR